MTDLPDFTSDCTSCAALCCLALAFDAGGSFAHDKRAGTGCHNLAPTQFGLGCSIHKDLTDKGYSGCVAYQCLGAGQRVTALFDHTWRDDPTMTAPMMDAFRQMRSVQACLQLLLASQALKLPRAIAAERANFIVKLTPDQWSTDSLSHFEKEGIEAEIKAWLRGLASYVQRTS